jgi:hypothetical protein
MSLTCLPIKVRVSGIEEMQARRRIVAKADENGQVYCLSYIRCAKVSKFEDIVDRLIDSRLETPGIESVGC